ncbi:MauE/DoxX family redox-associated membrane protein [Muricauda sp. TY007]|uniref:MauE/DoxX family redox-associated membrane protein n=1 Tax=Allomuricauda sp. TY007 TaxID=2683200 RepID=UPI0017AB62F1|nr:MULTISPECIES: MauE/DoxX family redox-associated membrane protein [unclassified Allomuricauda]MBA4744685.1 hypothetical protein [Allomuricauda sp.]
MKWSVKHIRITLEVICLLYIILFAYAAVNKLLDFESFRIQLAQSPLLTAHADWVAWTVPLSELIVAGMLFVPRLRFWGLCSAFFLMSMFTAYIVIILNFTDFIPCSCGGVLEDLGWTEHLVFNLLFVLLALIGILLSNPQGSNGGNQNQQRNHPWAPRGLTGKLLVIIGALALGSMSLVTGLFLWSEDMVHHRNNFTRRYPHHPIKRTYELDLGFNSYYLAGAGQGRIFLANPTSPLHMVVSDTTLRDTLHIQMKIPRENMGFRSIRTIVRPPYFYFMDGTVPIIFRGSTDTWSANPLLRDEAYFSLAVPLSPNTFAIRARSTQNNENELGLVRLGDSIPLSLKPDLLQKQVDGVFDTDGVLLHDPLSNQVVYVHYYHNKIILADTLLQRTRYGRTIDTISFPQIKVATLQKNNQRKMAAPPLIVNKRAAVHNGLLFVQGNLLGRNESEFMWKRASVIDVYDLMDVSYVLSFYVQHFRGKPLKDFLVAEGNFIGIFDQTLVTYKLQGPSFDGIRANAQNETLAPLQD